MGDAGAVMDISSMFLASCFLSLCFLLSLMLMALSSESAALTMSSEGKQFEGQAWREILGVLREQAGEVDEIVGEEYL